MRELCTVELKQGITCKLEISGMNYIYCMNNATGVRSIISEYTNGYVNYRFSSSLGLTRSSKNELIKIIYKYYIGKDLAISISTYKVEKIKRNLKARGFKRITYDNIVRILINLNAEHDTGVQLGSTVMLKENLTELEVTSVVRYYNS